MPDAQHHFQQRGLIQADPREHTRLRRALGGHFTAGGRRAPRRADRDRGRGLLDRAGRGRLDVIADLAAPLPVFVIAELLGVGAESRTGFPRWAGDAVRSSAHPFRSSRTRRISTRPSSSGEACSPRRSRSAALPRDDLLTVVGGLIDSGSMTLEEALFTCVHLLIAGHETTTNLIGNTVLCLLSNPAVMASVAKDRTLLPAAIDEVMRFEPRSSGSAASRRRIASCRVRRSGPDRR